MTLRSFPPPFRSTTPAGSLVLALALRFAIDKLGIDRVMWAIDYPYRRLAREGRLGARMGAAGSFKELGDMLGPILIGVVSQAFGLTAGFVGCGVLGLVALL